MYLQGLKEACVAGGPCVKGYGGWGGSKSWGGHRNDCQGIKEQVRDAFSQ